jgi:hypothetical protein
MLSQYHFPCAQICFFTAAKKKRKIIDLLQSAFIFIFWSCCKFFHLQQLFLHQNIWHGCATKANVQELTISRLSVCTPDICIADIPICAGEKAAGNEL